MLFPRQARQAKARLPQANLIMLPRCGHLPMTDDPRLVAEVLLSGSSTVAPAAIDAQEGGQPRVAP
jgi:pimeloyl-ACP methyl ester carboxylesterase